MVEAYISHCLGSSNGSKQASHLCIHVCVCTNVCICIYIYVYICLAICVYTHVYVHAYIYIYTYVYECMLQLLPCAIYNSAKFSRVRYFGCLKGGSKSVQVLLNGVECRSSHGTDFDISEIPSPVE